MVTPYYCPNCHAQCRTPESLGIHVSRCRAMSEGDIEEMIFEASIQVGGPDVSGYSVITDRAFPALAKSIHAHHIAKLRNRK